MNYVRVKSYAKINLTLDITGIQGRFHTVDSVVASVDICDVITAKKRKDKNVTVTMHGEGSENIPYEYNNAAKAAEAFVEKFATCGADITVWKNIPIGAGLGGSSADAAGVLNAMARLYKTDDFGALKELADGLGSDCGYMLTGGWARLGGRGETVKKLNSSLKLDVGILVPQGGVSSAQCYRRCDSFPKEIFTSGLAESAVVSGDKRLLCKCLSNGLTKAAEQLNCGVSECIQQLKAFDPLGVNMTGSGSAVFAVFENDQFLQYARSRYRGKNKFIATKTVLAVKEEKDGGREID